jgi:AraC-like DNA-binding protein
MSYVRKCRLGRVARYLATTNWGLVYIARQSGYESEVSLRRHSRDSSGCHLATTASRLRSRIEFMKTLKQYEAASQSQDYLAVIRQARHGIHLLKGPG